MSKGEGNTVYTGGGLCIAIVLSFIFFLGEPDLLDSLILALQSIGAVK